MATVPKYTPLIVGVTTSETGRLIFTISVSPGRRVTVTLVSGYADTDQAALDAITTLGVIPT